MRGRGISAQTINTVNARDYAKNQRARVHRLCGSISLNLELVYREIFKVHFMLDRGEGYLYFDGVDHGGRDWRVKCAGGRELAAEITRRLSA